MRAAKFLPVIWVTTLFLANCGGNSPSFSLLADSDSFNQSTGIVNDKIDILWVVDNSGSMQSSQDNLGREFNSFIGQFAAKSFNYKMAFTTTDAYRGRPEFRNNTKCIEFRDRILDWNCANVSGKTASGYKVLTPTLPGAALLESVFVHNSNTGIWGGGDERAFQSFKEVLSHPVNSAYNFLRLDSFMAIVIVSDENDTSWDGTSAKSPLNPTDPALHPIQSYVDYLDTLTGTTGARRRYSVNAITIMDDACLSTLNAQTPGRSKGTRYMDLANSTGGMSSSLCGNFSESLQDLSDSILSAATQFRLSRLPIENTIVVTINGAVMQRDTGTGGWQYIAESNSIKFIGQAYIPPQGSSIKVDYDPVAYGQ